MHIARYTSGAISARRVETLSHAMVPQRDHPQLSGYIVDGL